MLDSGSQSELVSMKDLEPVDQIEFQVLIDNVTDGLSTGPKALPSNGLL